MQITHKDDGMPMVALSDISFERCAASVRWNLTLQLHVSNILTKLPIFLKLPHILLSTWICFHSSRWIPMWQQLMSEVFHILSNTKRKVT